MLLCVWGVFGRAWPISVSTTRENAPGENEMGGNGTGTARQIPYARDQGLRRDPKQPKRELKTKQGMGGWGRKNVLEGEDKREESKEYRAVNELRQNVLTADDRNAMTNPHLI
jgi:hypothetical protein